MVFIGGGEPRIDDILMSPQLNATLKQDTAALAQEMGVSVLLWDTIDNLVATKVAWTKSLLDHLKLFFVLNIPFWSSYTGILIYMDGLSLSKSPLPGLVSSHLFCLLFKQRTTLKR